MVRFTVVMPEIAAVNSRILDAVIVYTTNGQTGNGPALMDPYNFIYILFLSGAIFIAVLTLKRLAEIAILIRNNSARDAKDINIIILPEKYPSFSFFRHIFISGDDISVECRNQVIKHETAHAYQLHSLDIIILQIIKILQWFNPFIYILEKYLKEIHEYLADSAVTEQEGRTDGYELLLLSQAFGIKPGIINFFNASLIKKRLIMMTKPKSQPHRKVKYLSVLPLLALVLIFFNCSEDMSITASPSLKEAKQQSPFPPPPPATGVSENEPVFVFVEETATFQGGDLESFRAWIAENIIYPEDAKAENIYGRVTVQFAVNTTGKVTNVTVIRGIDDRLDNEAVRVIQSSPDWEPATQGGRPVNQLFTIPVIFAISN